MRETSQASAGLAQESPLRAHAGTCTRGLGCEAEDHHPCSLKHVVQPEHKAPNTENDPATTTTRGHHEPRILATSGSSTLLLLRKALLKVPMTCPG